MQLSEAFSPCFKTVKDQKTGEEKEVSTYDMTGQLRGKSPTARAPQPPHPFGSSVEVFDLIALWTQLSTGMNELLDKLEEEIIKPGKVTWHGLTTGPMSSEINLICFVEAPPFPFMDRDDNNQTDLDPVTSLATDGSTLVLVYSLTYRTPYDYIIIFSGNQI
ncbi:hypothetical protein THAOC_35614 [Thalassiosira oceanica]|uniref:Uncharacterized protein n=1 Tax=Thalassiosira oceanica TaxID=159749 RepID=K0R342_THAOC|nr:hypothetical protein THAOC_35614 [Thalassiosira oceanica]|eukprot:EJK45759.1 hypothetical protein THAOC_35614 [Thalassiosira oceanica]